MIFQARLSWRAYLLIVVAISLPGLSFQLFWTSRAILACGAGGYSADAFVAECDSPGFGDYDHGAFFFGFEPEAVENLRKAQILLLGNSRSLYAMSTQPVRDYFARRGWSFYDLAFAYGESADFPAALIEKYRLHPAALIINADGFFSLKPSQVAATLLSDNRSGPYWLYLSKKVAQIVHRAACGAQAWLPMRCGSATAIYRSRTDGSWDTRFYDQHGHFPVITGAELTPELVRSSIASARAFLHGIALDPRCIIVTAVPSDVTPYGFVEQLAAALSLPLLRPQVGPLFTLDHSHLDPPSAAAWSAELLRQADPILRGCLAGTRPSPAIE